MNGEEEIYKSSPCLWQSNGVSLVILWWWWWLYTYSFFPVFNWDNGFLKFDKRAIKKNGELIFNISFYLSDGLYFTRIGFAEGVWMVGMVDEVRMPVTETDRNPILVDIKTRVQDTLPAEPQRRNGRYTN